ncbi:MAG: TetR/AcrR family transcriptional regulator [Verrucomicrobia bacterium]|nr:TetR/AcrR family transcriptional regulator [Verrucomicrobiota bacterium]
MDENPVRQRIVGAAFAVFVERGYSDANTLEIATRAKVSKRELYALVGNKQEMLVACITERAKRFRMPEAIPPACDRESLARGLMSFGARLLREVSESTVVSVFRLAIAEAERNPRVAEALDTIGRGTSRAALIEILNHARSLRLLEGNTSEMAEQFTSLLWGDLMLSLLLRVADSPTPREIKRRAKNAATTLLELYPAPAKLPVSRMDTS